MNNILIGVAGAVLLIALYVLFDEPESSISATQTTAQTQPKETDKQPESDITITYEQTEKPEPVETKKTEEAPKKERPAYSQEIEDSKLRAQNLIQARNLKPTVTSKNQPLTFQDKEGRYGAQVMVPKPTTNYQGIPMIPVAITLEMPTGNKINTHIDPILLKENGETYVYIKDQQTGMEQVVDISQDVIQLQSGAIVNLQVDEQGRVTQQQRPNNNGNNGAPPMPPSM